MSWKPSRATPFPLLMERWFRVEELYCSYREPEGPDTFSDLLFLPSGGVRTFPLAAGSAGDDGAGVAIWASLCVSKAELTGFPAGCDMECECQESSQRLQAEGQEGGSSVARQSRPHPTLAVQLAERAPYL